MAWISPYLFGKEGMGGGDIKLLAMIGAFLGWQQVLLTVIVGGLLGAVLGVGLIAARVISRSDYIPFGPFLSRGGGRDAVRPGDPGVGRGEFVGGGGRAGAAPSQQSLFATHPPPVSVF